MKYNYSEISSKQFENLIIHLCYKLLGFGTKTFSDGADGGRDARFDGTANEIPSRNTPWSGLTIIQAKHTVPLGSVPFTYYFLMNLSLRLN